jgi:hypothetical protein
MNQSHVIDSWIAELARAGRTSGPARTVSAAERRKGSAAAVAGDRRRRRTARAPVRPLAAQLRPCLPGA